jgi:cation:H+ antiporter
MMSFLFILAGLGLLVVGGNLLLKAAVSVSLRLSIPKIVVGMTVVSFATSLPELVVSVNAALAGSPSIALGNVVGSNAANLGLVLGVTLLFGSMQVKRSFYVTDWPVMMVASMLLWFFLVNDGVLQRPEGAILLLLLFGFLWYLLKVQQPAVEDELPEDDELLSPLKNLVYLGIGVVGLWLGSEWLVNGAIDLAQTFGVSDRVIGITVVSIGTSIPELAASIIAMLRKEKAISLGNLVGSNIFNIMAVLAITGLIQPIKVDDPQFLSSDVLFMLGFAVALLPLVLLSKKRELNYLQGVALLAGYLFFIYQVI